MQLNKETKDKLDQMINGFLKIKNEEDSVKKKKMDEHMSKYHFKTIDEIMEWLKSGKRIWKDVSYDHSVDEYFEYRNGLIERHVKDGDEETPWSYYGRMTEDGFRKKYFFALMEYKEYILNFHKEKGGV